jgi:hypothetical protein
MEYVPSLATIAGLVLLGCISPGPNFLVVTSTAMSVSRRAGVAAGLGVALASLRDRYKITASTCYKLRSLNNVVAFPISAVISF